MGAERLTYTDLDGRANRLARHLRASGVRPGDRVALRLERSAEMVIAILAVLKAGAAYVPIDPSHPAERVAFTLEDSGASLLVTSWPATSPSVPLLEEREGPPGRLDLVGCAARTRQRGRCAQRTLRALRLGGAPLLL
jgi:non-ribosomal peptide synthetase component F